MELSRLSQQFRAMSKRDSTKSETKATDLIPCTSRMPVVGDQVTCMERRTSNEGLWVLSPGEIATVSHVDEDGDFTLCNPAGVVSKFVYREHYHFFEEVEFDDACPDLRDFYAKVPPRNNMKRQSIVGDDVQAAWMARGWTLHTQIHKHGSAALQEMICPSGEGMTRSIEDFVNERQKSLNMLRVINKHLRNSLLMKKNKEQELRTKIDALVERLTAACGVEKRAREASENALEERILTEEKEKQDMQLALSQDIRMHEESIARVRTSNEALVETNVRNKKLMKEQQAQIKERQKAVRHLEWQIHILEGAQKNSRNSSPIPENGCASVDRPKVVRREETFTHYDDDEGDGMLNNERDRALEKGDSKGLLRGAAAEKHLEEEKKRLKAQRLQTQDVTTNGTARTMADIKSLPGLDLNKLLGIAQPVDSEKTADRLPQ